MDSFIFVNLVGMSTGVLLGAALLLESRHADRAVLYLGLLTVMEAVMLLRGVLSYGGLMQSYPHLIAVLLPLAYLKGPLLYLLVSAAGGGISDRLWRHAVPTLLSAIILIPLYLLSAPEKFALYAVYHGPDTVSTMFTRFSLPVAVNVFQPVAFGLVLLVYAVAALRWIRRAGGSQPASFAVILSSLMLLEAVLRVGGLGIAFVAGSPPIGVAVKTAAVLIVIAVYFKGIVILRQGLAARRARDVDSPAVGARTEPGPRYARSGLDAVGRAELLARFEALMDTENLFLDNELSLAKLAERLETTPNRLSQALNEGRGVSFNRALADYRLAHSRALLADPAQAGKAIVDIAMEAGFNDKSTFYRQFKQVHGQTPAAYRTAQRQA